MTLLTRIYDFLWCLTLLAPMAWKLTSKDWDITFSTNGFTGKRLPPTQKNTCINGQTNDKGE
jgi:hypothetical protein